MANSFDPGAGRTFGAGRFPLWSNLRISFTHRVTAERICSLVALARSNRGCPGLSTALADRYKIERHLGEGGMATVYLAEDLKHHRKAAASGELNVVVKWFEEVRRLTEGAGRD